MQRKYEKGIILNIEKIKEEFETFNYDKYYKKVIKNYVYYSGKRLLA